MGDQSVYFKTDYFTGASDSASGKGKFAFKFKLKSKFGFWPAYAEPSFSTAKYSILAPSFKWDSATDVKSKESRAGKVKLSQSFSTYYGPGYPPPLSDLIVGGALLTEYTIEDEISVKDCTGCFHYINILSPDSRSHHLEQSHTSFCLKSLVKNHSRLILVLIVILYLIYLWHG